jgi:hypothetical protein
MSGMKVTGFEELQSALRAFGSEAEAHAALRPAMTAAGSKILKRSIELTPRDRGGLVSSAGVRLTEGLTVEIGYGAPYTRKVHDNPRSGKTGGRSPSGKRYRHWAATGQAKFLETAMREAEQTAWPDVAKGVETWLRQHGR